MFFKKISYILAFAYIAFAIGLFSISRDANAQVSVLDLMPATGSTVTIDSNLASNEQTHPPLRLTPDKSQIIDLDSPISRVIIGNEVHLNILMDSMKRIIAVPRTPGATHFTLLDDNGQIVMQRHVIVASPKEQYIRVRETCVPGSTMCVPIRMFYCPGMCHEIAILGAENTAYSSSIAGPTGNEPETETMTIVPTTNSGDSSDGGSGNTSDGN